MKRSIYFTVVILSLAVAAGCNGSGGGGGSGGKGGNATSYFVISVARPGSGYTASLVTDGGTDRSQIAYPGLVVRWANPDLRLKNLSVSADGSIVTFTIHSKATTLIKRIWMFASADSATMTSVPRLTNSRGDHVFVIGPIEAGGNRSYTLSATGFNAAGYKFYLDFVQIEDLIAFSSNRLDPNNVWENEVFSGDTSAQDITQVTSDPSAIYNTSPAWSAGGEWVSYLRGGYETCTDGSTVTSVLRPQVYIVHPDGSNRQLVSAGSFMSYYSSFNPSGTVIAYDCHPDCNQMDTGICTYNIETGERRQIFSGAGYYHHSLFLPRWSPNGQYIVVLANDLSQNEMWLYAHVDPDTGEPLEPLQYFTGYPAVLSDEYYWKGLIMDWAWGPDSLHAAVTTYRYLCWCGANDADPNNSKNINCDLPGKPANCSWKYFNNATTFPQNSSFYGTGIVDFSDALNAAALPIWLSFDRLDGILAWTSAFSPVTPGFNDNGSRLFYALDDGTGKSSLRYINLNNYSLDGASQHTYLTDNYYNRTPVLFPPILDSFFPIPP